MKKLIMMVAVVAAAVAANAATFTWKTTSTGKVYYSGGASTYSGTAYLFDATSGTVTEQAVLAAILGGTAVPSSLASTAITSGAISTTATGDKFDVPSKYSAGTSVTTFFATFYTEGKQTYAFISSEASATVPGTGDNTFSFNAKDASKAAVTTFAKDATITFNGSGWYTVAAGTDPTPEPTSGLLLLLGVAGLALKRKHA